MSLHWSSLADFLAMGGYGLYVWGSFGMTALVVAAELWAVRARRNAVQEEDFE
jgi:heme exporter protein D